MPDTSPELPAELASELGAVLDAFQILAPLSFSFLGEPPVDVGAAAPGSGWVGAGLAAPNDSTSDDLLVKAVQSALYDRCYARRLGTPRMPSGDATVEDPDFAYLLSEANAGREHWDAGWTIYQFGPNGQIFVRKGERERAAMPGAFISDSVPGMAPQPGANVSLRAPREGRGIQPGYYFAFGETLDEAADQLDLVRLYFHCGAESAAPLFAALTSALNRFQVPFQMKAPTIPGLYDRTDAVVLYIGARYFTITVQIVTVALERVALEPAVPLFTKRLWPGIGAAVEPGTGESFGLHRCRLAAEGIVAAWREGKQDVTTRLAAVAAQFAAAGLDLAHPYLGPGRADRFLLPAPASRP
jgi:HopA1 effector protein family